MDYRTIIDKVARTLSKRWARCRVSYGAPVAPSGLVEAEARLGIPLPADLAECYSDVGNGCSLVWHTGTFRRPKAIGGFVLPKLSELVSDYHEWRAGVLYNADEAEAYGFPYTHDPELAKTTAARMWQWLPVLREMNGDQIAIDMSGTAGSIVFDQHDWLDGGTGENGYVLASNWREFMQRWADFCFQHTRNWRSVANPKSPGWDETLFDARFKCDSGK